MKGANVDGIALVFILALLNIFLYISIKQGMMMDAIMYIHARHCSPAT